MQAGLDREAKAARRTTMPPSTPTMRRYTPLEEDRTSAPSTPLGWRAATSIEGSATPVHGVSDSLAFGGGGHELRSRSSDPQISGPVPHHFPVRLFTASNYSSLAPSLTPSPVGTPSPLRRAHSSSAELGARPLASKADLLPRPSSSFPSFHFDTDTSPAEDPLVHATSPRTDTSPTWSLSPGPSPDYTFPARSSPRSPTPVLSPIQPIAIPSSVAIADSDSSSTSSPRPKRKPSLQPHDSGLPMSVSPLRQTLAMPRQGIDRLVVSAPPSLKRESSSGEESDEEDNGGESGIEGGLRPPPLPDKKLSNSAEAVPVAHSASKRKSVSPTDYLFPALPPPQPVFPPKPSLPKHPAPITRCRSVSSIPALSPRPPEVSPSVVLDLEAQVHRAKAREEVLESRVSELAAEVELLKVREEEWESQAEGLLERVEEMERVAAGGLEGLLAELGVNLTTTSPIILASSLAALSHCSVCSREIPLHDRARYWLTEHWKCLPRLTRVVALANQLVEQETEVDGGENEVLSSD